MLKLIKFLIVLMISSLCLASTDYIAPTLVPATQSERQFFIENYSQERKDKQYVLAKLALVVEDSSATLDDALVVIRMAENLAKETPEDMELLSAIGSITSYMSTFYKNNLGKMNFYSRKGTRMMDRAVKKSPNNLGARLQRGIASASMPKFLNRAHLAVKDLSLVNDVIGEKSGNDFQSMVNFYLAMALSKTSETDKAKKLLDDLTKKDEGVWSLKAQALLEDI